MLIVLIFLVSRTCDPVYVSCSNFTEIFDVDWFISSLSKDVKIIKELPKRGGKAFAGPQTMRVPRKCTPRCYQNRVLPVLLKRHVSVQLSGTSPSHLVVHSNLSGSETISSIFLAYK